MPRQAAQTVRTLIIISVVGALGIAFIGPDSDTFGPIVLIIFVFGFIALSFKMAAKMTRSFAGQDIIDAGIPATGVIVSMSETGTTVNQNPLVEFSLRVTTADGAMFDATTSQMLPRLLLGQVSPGTEVAVAVLEDGADRRVAIDWQRTTAGEAGADTRRITAGHLAGARLNDGVVDRDDFLRTAVSATGEIDAVSETGATGVDPSTGLDFDAYGFTVTVMRAGRDPYQTKLVQGIPADLVGKIGPGARVPIGINPDDPTDIVIDWDSHRG